MRRWNGWGDHEQHQPLTAPALEFLRARIGASTPTRDASRESVLAVVPASRFARGLFRDDPALRLDLARGQSYPDWLALRYGRIGSVADAVALPETTDEAAEALKTAIDAGAIVIPYGGGTSVVGHLDVPAGERPVVNLSMARLNRLLAVDHRNWTARFEAGTPGPLVESQLRQHGYLLGHFPQSYEYSTVGGWVVTRSSGQQSLRYGRIEQLFHGGTLLTPRGVLAIGGWPASSAGPDVREAVMGSEGRLGLVTEATLRIRPLPTHEDFHAVFFPNWDAGLEAIRALAQADLGLSMLRLSNEVETETQLALAGHEKLIVWLRRYLKVRKVGERPVMLLIGTTGSHREVLRLKRESLSIAKQHRGVNTGRAIGKGWAKNRFKGPYLRNSLWEAGYGADTVETCVSWAQATSAMRAIEATAKQVFADSGEEAHVFTHLSHVYRQGCSVYSTFVFRAGGDYERDLERWTRLKRAVSEAIVASGGTVSHQHGVGRDHAPYLIHEKGALGLDLMRAMAREFDPQSLMNPGKLFTP
jgi:alkyldihydroxyacetonephosphate synthase